MFDAEQVKHIRVGIAMNNDLATRPGRMPLHEAAANVACSQDLTERIIK
jgi:hypothetical protein